MLLRAESRRLTLCFLICKMGMTSTYSKETMLVTKFSILKCKLTKILKSITNCEYSCYKQLDAINSWMI